MNYCTCRQWNRSSSIWSSSRCKSLIKRSLLSPLKSSNCSAQMYVWREPHVSISCKEIACCQTTLTNFLKCNLSLSPGNSYKVNGIFSRFTIWIYFNYFNDESSRLYSCWVECNEYANCENESPFLSYHWQLLYWLECERNELSVSWRYEYTNKLTGVDKKMLET